MLYLFQYSDNDHHLNSFTEVVDCENDTDANNTAHNLLAIRFDAIQDKHSETLANKRVQLNVGKRTKGVICWSVHTPQYPSSKAIAITLKTLLTS